MKTETTAVAQNVAKAQTKAGKPSKDQKTNKSVKADKGNPKAPAKAGKPESKKTTKQRVLVLKNYSVYAVSQWAALQGYNFASIRQAMDKLVGAAATDANIRTAMSDSKNEKYSKPAKVTADDAKRLKALLGAKPKAEKKAKKEAAAA